MRLIAATATADYALLYLKQGPVTLGYHALERMLQVAEETGAAMVYADHYSVEAGKTVKHPRYSLSGWVASVMTRFWFCRTSQDGVPEGVCSERSGKGLSVCWLVQPFVCS